VFKGLFPKCKHREKEVQEMEAYAVVETGGKQYRVQAGDTLQVEKLDAAVGENITLDQVLALSDGSSLKVGKPVVDGATVQAVVEDQIRGEKVINFKKKRRKGYTRKVGHRQSLTVLKVESIA
jgi:large subunit ribosomal protein L21